MKSYDAIIAGGGLIGSAIALELARNDLRVALFDSQDPGREASWASAGILSPAPENPGMISMVPFGKAIVALHRGLGLKAEAISALEARDLEPDLSEETEAAVLRPDEASVDNRLLAR